MTVYFSKFKLKALKTFIKFTPFLSSVGGNNEETEHKCKTTKKGLQSVKYPTSVVGSSPVSGPTSQQGALLPLPFPPCPPVCSLK